MNFLMLRAAHTVRVQGKDVQMNAEHTGSFARTCHQRRPRPGDDGRGTGEIPDEENVRTNRRGLEKLA